MPLVTMPRGVRRRLAGPHVDAWLAAAIGVLGETIVWLAADAGDDRWRLSAGMALAAGAVVFRRSRPLLGAVAWSAAVVVAGADLGLEPAAANVGFILALLLVAYGAGAHEERVETSAAVALLLVGAQWAALLAAEAPADDYAAPLVGVGASWFAGRLALRERRQARRLAEANAQLELERARAEQAAVAEERTRIAREVHDIVGHSLTVVALQAAAGQAALPREPDRAQRALDAIERTAREALGEVRHVIAALREADDDAAPASLATLERLVEEARGTGSPIDLHADGIAGLPRAVDASALRIVQEALTNARRHAPGAQVAVSVRRRNGALGVRVANGPGHAPGGGGGSGHGLAGARERVRALGGTMAAGPDGAGGWIVEATLPLDDHGR